MSIQRVAVIFDNRSRPETTGVYCRRALGQLVEVEHFLPTELSRIPRRGFDLYLNIDDGLEYRLPADLRPAAWWAIDTHMNLPWYKSKGPDFDLVCTAQRDGAEHLRQGGIASATWLPLACDPELHARPRAAQRPTRSPPAAISEYLYRPMLLRGDGPDLFGLAHRLQPQRPQ